MANHVHMLTMRESADSLSQAVGEALRRHTAAINRWMKAMDGPQLGHLRQGRFSWMVMDETHLLTAARYIELNPVRAEMVKKPDEYKWS